MGKFENHFIIVFCGYVAKSHPSERLTLKSRRLTHQFVILNRAFAAAPNIPPFVHLNSRLASLRSALRRPHEP